MNVSASHAKENDTTELAENRALLHRVLKEKQALLAKCAAQEVALAALRAEIEEADEARSADAVRLAFKEAALQEQSGWNAQLERKLAEAEAKAKRPHEPRTLAPSRSRSRVPVATPPSAGSSLRRDLRALAQAKPADVVSAPPPSKLRPPTPTRKPPTQKPPTPTRKPPTPTPVVGQRRDARKPEYARRSALPTPPAPRHVEVSLPLPDSTLTDEQVEGRAIVSAMVRRVLARVCEESVLPPPPPPPTEPSKAAEPAAAAHQDKVRWDDMMLSALEQQEAALLDSIHDLDKRLSDAPSVGGFVF